MMQTYELMMDVRGQRVFVPLTCRPGELITLARRALAEAGASSCDITQFGDLLFSLDVADAPPRRPQPANAP